MDDYLVVERHRLRGDLSGRRDDAGSADQCLAVFEASLGGRRHPQRVLVGAGLHRQMVVEHSQMRQSRRFVEKQRRVVAEQHDLGAIQAQHEAIALYQKLLGRRPLGWNCRSLPSINTRDLLVEEGGFLYHSDPCNDDLPYFLDHRGTEILVVPYSKTLNDSRYLVAPGYSNPRDFAEDCRSAIDYMADASVETTPQNLFFTAQDYETQGANLKASPPLRSPHGKLRHRHQPDGRRRLDGGLTEENHIRPCHKTRSLCFPQDWFHSAVRSPRLVHR